MYRQDINIESEWDKSNTQIFTGLNFLISLE